MVRGRGLRDTLPEGAPPEFGLYLLAERPPTVAWESRWVRWPDFRLPADHRDAAEALHTTWRRCASERVEVACVGGRGRTGTALACIAVLDGVLAAEAVDYVREHYVGDAVETPWQRWYIRCFANRAAR